MGDQRGSDLFEEIVHHDDYYLPAAEVALLNEHMSSIAVHDLAVSTKEKSAISKQFVIELGAGAGHKTMSLLDHMAKEASHTVYVPMDISGSALDENRQYFTKHFDNRQDVSIMPIVGPHELCMSEVVRLTKTTDNRTYLFLGSSLGNLCDKEIKEFFELVGTGMQRQDRFLLFLDREHGPTKPEAKILGAYNDSSGITAAF